MIAESNPKTIDFNYVWRCGEAKPLEGQSIPIRAGDYLYICVMDDGTASFRYRSCDWRDREPCEVARKNEAEWAGATGRFNGKMIEGHLASRDRKFEMTIEPKGYGFTISCRHFVNPDEGGWNGDDGWGGQQG